MADRHVWREDECPECSDSLDAYGPDWCRSHMDRQRDACRRGPDAVCKRAARFPVDEPPYCDCVGGTCRKGA